MFPEAVDTEGWNDSRKNINRSSIQFTF